MSTRVEVAGSSLERRQSLEAIRHRPCVGCGAPARHLSHDSIREGWPGCWVPRGDPREGTGVRAGESCPNCGATRSVANDDDLGEIWVREWRLPRLARIGLWLTNIFRRKG